MMQLSKNKEDITPEVEDNKDEEEESDEQKRE